MKELLFLIFITVVNSQFLLPCSASDYELPNRSYSPASAHTSSRLLCHSGLKCEALNSTSADDCLNPSRSGFDVDAELQVNWISCFGSSVSKNMHSLVDYGDHASYTVSGTVLDSASSETLPNASISVIGTSIVTQSNSQGVYALRLPAGRHTVHVSYVGYIVSEVELRITKDIKHDFYLVSNAYAFGEVQISGNSPVRDVIPGRSTVSIERIKNIPSLGGEPDLLKALQFLPGVQSPAEGTTNLAVRGGTYDQTLVLLDDAPVYNPSHALSFFSVFNTEALKATEVYKGLIPVRYGGRLSSVVDVRMRDGNAKNYQTKLGLGLISSQLTTEGPIKEAGSFIVSGRYGYPGASLNGFGSLFKYVFNSWSLRNFDNKNRVSFYDVNARLNFRDKSGSNRFFVSAYQGHDAFNYYLLNNNMFLEWGNTTASAQWNHTFHPRLFSTTVFTFSNYRYTYTLNNDRRNFDWSSNQQEVNYKTEFDYTLSANSQLNFGVHFAKNVMMPGSIQPHDSLSVTKSFQLPERRSAVATVFIGNEVSLSPSLRFYFGLRQSWFSLLGPGTEFLYADDWAIQDTVWHPVNKFIKVYPATEPRMAVNYSMGDNSALKLALTKTVQFMHLLSNSSIGLPTDIWMPSNRNIKPQQSWQSSLGYYRSTANDQYAYSVEGYIKQMSHVIDFIDNADLFVNPAIESQIRSGKGKAYGLEMLLEKKQGALTGWASYTWAKTYRTIPGINDGEPYPVPNDRRHSVSLVGNYDIAGTRLAIAANTVFNTGAPLTVPSGTFVYQGAAFNYYGKRNSFRLPPYHRMDISVILRQREKEKREGKWVFSVYNVYNRQNIFTVFQAADDYDFSSSKLSGLSMFGVVPSVTYSVLFK